MYEIMLFNMHEPILAEIKIEITSYKLPRNINYLFNFCNAFPQNSA